MEYQSFLIKYAEIGIKGKNRYLFEDALIRQIQHALKDVDGKFQVTKEQGRVYVEPEGEFPGEAVRRGGRRAERADLRGIGNRRAE